MSFVSYLKSSGILDNRQFQSLSDKAGLARMDTFEYLLKTGEIEGRKFELEELAKLLEGWGPEVNRTFVQVYDTKGWQVNRNVYKAAGGINERIVERILPLVQEHTGKNILITMRPSDEGLLNQLDRWYAGIPYLIGVCSEEMWQSLYKLYVQPLLIESMATVLSETSDAGTVQNAVNKDSEARRFYRHLLNIGIEQGASDVHFIPCSDRCEVHFRIDGENTHYTDIHKNVLSKLNIILQNDGHVSVKNPREPIDGKVRYSPSDGKVPGDEIDLRISIIPSKAGPDINVRYLSSRLFTFEQLGMSEDNIKMYKALLDLPSGMIVQVGPTGSGKSTTLYTGLAYVHESLRNVMTAEDPVEILMDGVTQIDVDNEPNSPLKFSDALKAALRHDPDVIVVGELRDKATAELAVRASNTGHLVLTSLHTNDSIGAFERLINMGVDPYSLGEVMVAVMGQRLVRRLCPHCKKAYEVGLKTMTARFYGLPNKEGSMTFYAPGGCIHCNNTGYKGRVAINEVLVIDSTIRNFIQKHEVREVFEQELRKRKFNTMYSDGLQKAIQGITSLDELKKFAADTIAFKG